MNRGGIFALVSLAVARMSVSFQFQSVTPLAGQVGFPVTPAALGALLGLYMAPGVVAAVAAPTLLRRFGSIGLLAIALGLMVLGHFGLAIAESLNMAYASRLVAGLGGCIVYVITVAFAADLHEVGSPSGRMGLIASSWPVGNALALVLLGSVLAQSSFGTWMPLVPVILATAMIALHRQRLAGGGPASTELPRVVISFGAWRRALRGGFGIALSFALYNVALILVTSFSARLLVADGFSSQAASTVSSLPMWVCVVSVPLGGLLASLLTQYDRAQVAAGCFGSALCLLLVLITPYKVVWYVLIGLLGGLPTAPMWANAGGKGSADTDESHLTYPALFLVFFASLLVFPPALGVIVELTDDPRLVLPICSVMLVISSILYSWARSGRSA